MVVLTFFNDHGKNLTTDHSIMWMIAICLSFGQFVYEFVKQRAQYSIKSIMILTVYVAVLCSLYVCFGMLVVFVAMFLTLIGIFAWTEEKMEK